MNGSINMCRKCSFCGNISISLKCWRDFDEDASLVDVIVDENIVYAEGIIWGESTSRMNRDAMQYECLRVMWYRGSARGMQSSSHLMMIKTQQTLQQESIEVSDVRLESLQVGQITKRCNMNVWEWCDAGGARWGCTPSHLMTIKIQQSRVYWSKWCSFWICWTDDLRNIQVGWIAMWCSINVGE